MILFAHVCAHRYSDQQAAMQAKQKMLREDWEFFSAQRKILKDTIMKNQSARRSSKSSMEAPLPLPSPDFISNPPYPLSCGVVAPPPPLVEYKSSNPPTDIPPPPAEEPGTEAATWLVSVHYYS